LREIPGNREKKLAHSSLPDGEEKRSLFLRKRGCLEEWGSSRPFIPSDIHEGKKEKEKTTSYY